MEAQTDRIASSLGGATVTRWIWPSIPLLRPRRTGCFHWLDDSKTDTWAFPRSTSLRRGCWRSTASTSMIFRRAPESSPTKKVSCSSLAEPIPAPTVPLQPLSNVVRVPQGYSSIPGAFITPQLLEQQGWSTARVGWLIEANADLTDEQIAAARRTGRRSRPARRGAAWAVRHLPWLTGATVAGMLVALSVLAMTVGLIRAETARDLRTLTATGATSSTRRTVTGATAGALGLLGGLVGTAGAYTVMLALNYDDVGALLPVPVVHLLAIIVGLPLLAAIAGWVLARGEPSGISRQPIT